MNGNTFNGWGEYIDYLRWQCKCYELDGIGFQALFEEVMRRLEPESFEAIAPCGKLGDRKADGILYGAGTVYQVFSPWDLKRKRTLTKIDKDLAGAVLEWGDDLKRWVFVYNTRNRKSVYADIVMRMRAKEDEYPALTLERVSDYRLWRRVREELGAADRTEILGPLPEGIEHTIFPRPGMSADELEQLRNSRVVLLHQGNRPIDLTTALEALEPEMAFGPPVRLEPPVDEVGWIEAARQQAHQVEDLIAAAGSQLARYAVFPLSDIPLLLHLGFVLSDRADVKLFQYHRERRSWGWAADGEADTDIRVAGLPDATDDRTGEVCVLVSLSAQIQSQQVAPWTAEALGTIEISVADPDTRWLKHPEQLAAISSCFHDVWKRIRRTWPYCSRVHLLYAGPAPGAVAIGQTINPRMVPPVATYQFDRGYTPALELPLPAEAEDADHD
jgi:hypothetical protein